MGAVKAIPYRQTEFPPFPAVQIQLEHLLGATEPIGAKIDTGASRTVVPTGLLECAGAIRTGRTATCRAYDGTPCTWPIYQVTLRVVDVRWPEGAGREFERALVLGIEGETEVPLGRDVLAAWRLHLDGPQSRYSVE